MDPNANLQEQLRISRGIVALIESIGDCSRLDPCELESYDERRANIQENIVFEAETLTELVLALDEWRRKGGFDPYRTDPCTGSINKFGHLAHDGDTCPVHEQD